MEKEYAVNIYVEQTIKGLKRENGWYGYFIEFHSSNGPVIRDGYDLENNTTAHEIELLAILYALQRITKPCVITIHSGHGYFKTAFMCHWLEKWKENDWKNAKGKPVEHQVIWKAIDKELSKHSIIIGNPKHKYQELIKQGIKRQMSMPEEA